MNDQLKGPMSHLTPDPTPFSEILSRTLRSKCPVCGEGRMFAGLSQLNGISSLFIPVERCAKCDFKFARQPGYYFGVITPILPILSLILGVVFAGIAYLGFQQELENVIQWGLAGLGIGFFLFFRTAIALYIALDHAIDPPSR